MRGQSMIPLSTQNLPKKQFDVKVLKETVVEDYLLVLFQNGVGVEMSTALAVGLLELLQTVAVGGHRFVEG